MFVTVITVCAAALCFAVFAWRRTTKNKAELEQHSISAQELHDSIHSGRSVLLFDVRQPLDILAYPERIPGSQRVPPAEVLEKPSIIPKDKDAVVYCTCPSDKTSRMVLRKALELGYSHMRFLRGGLSVWKAMGFPVEPYTGSLSFSSSAGSLPR